MKLIQKSSDRKALVVISAFTVLGLLFYWLASPTTWDTVSKQSLENQTLVTQVTALDSDSVTGTVAVGDLLRVCPSEEIIDKMPTLSPSQNPPSIYFILDGERRELDEFDLPWVAANCDVGEQAVY